jgi:hypothetical protein
VRLLGARETDDSFRDDSFRLPGRSELPTLGIYAAAAALYIAIGVWKPTFLLPWFGAAGFLVVFAWLLPAACKRRR